MSAAVFPRLAPSPAERFAWGMAHALRATVMYPPDRSLFRPFRMRTDADTIAGTLSRARSPLGLYVHVPFCETKCTYCDYETVPLRSHDAASIDAYVVAILAELDAVAAALPAGTRLSGLDIGGGTPGTLSAAQFESIVEQVAARFALADGFEISTETTPTLAAADPAKWRAIARAGVSRVSMGVQTSDAALLGALSRGLHGADRVRAGMTSLRAAGFARVNVDLMFGLPGLSDAAWERTLDLAVDLAPDVVTVYDTVYKNRGIAIPRAERPVPGPDAFGRQYDAAFSRLSAEGFSSRYGSVNFSRSPGRLGTSRYLQSRLLDGADYVGVGLYASSLIGETWRFGRRRYAEWLDHAERRDLAAQDLYRLPRAHVMAKYLLLALSYGFLDAERFSRRFGESLDDRFGDSLQFAERCGLLRRAPDGWEMVEGSFVSLPGVRALFYPEEALPLLAAPVLRPR